MGAGINGQAAPPPRPPLNRRAVRTTGAAAPSRWGKRILRSQPRAPPDAQASGCANDGRCRALTLGEAHTAEPAPRPARRSSVGLCERRALPRPHAGGSACCGASPAPAGRRAFSADVHVRADAAGWSSWVAERSPTDATLWLLTHHACTPGASRHCDGARRML